MKMTPDKITEDKITALSDSFYLLSSRLDCLCQEVKNSNITPEQAAEKWNGWIAELDETIKKITQ